MIKRYQQLIYITIICGILIVIVPNYTAAHEATPETIDFDFKQEQFIAPLTTGFSSAYTQNILKTHTPHHNGYDVILDRNATQYIDGKFQYGDFRKDLEGEWISIYTWDLSTPHSKWKRLGREKTDKDGRIHYRISEENKLGPGLHLIKLYVEGDGTEANMYMQILNHNKNS